MDAVSDQYHWVDPNVLNVCPFVSCRKTLRQRLFPPADLSWDIPVDFVVRTPLFFLVICLITTNITSQFAFAAVRTNHYLEVFFIQGVLGGVASGILFLPATSIIAQHFAGKRPIASAIVLMGMHSFFLLMPGKDQPNEIAYNYTGSFVGGIIQVVAVNKLVPLHRGSNEFLMTAM